MMLKVAEKYRSEGYAVSEAAGTGVVPKEIDHLRGRIDLRRGQASPCLSAPAWGLPFIQLGAACEAK